VQGAGFVLVQGSVAQGLNLERERTLNPEP
jgi:hypothetical protein